MGRTKELALELQQQRAAEMMEDHYYNEPQTEEEYRRSKKPSIRVTKQKEKTIESA